MQPSIEVDVLIIGGGMSGLSAGIVCSQNGLRTLIVEKSSELGGSAALSAGMFWAPRDAALAHQTIPLGNPELQEAFISEYLDAVQWMRDQGISVAPPFHGIMSIGVGFPIDIKAFIARARDIIAQNASSEVRYNSAVTDLITAYPAKTSPVVGATARQADGTFVEIRAGSTISLPLHPSMGSNPHQPVPHPPLLDCLGPYWALEVQPSITFTYGGASVRPRTAQALTADGAVIAGLYVVGMDAGGFSNWRYCGGLELAFVMGRWAAGHVVGRLKGEGEGEVEDGRGRRKGARL